MTKILLIGHFGFTNLGCEAIVRTTVEIIRKHVPDAWITLISRTAKYDRAVIERNRIRVDEILSSAGKIPRFTPGWAIQALSRRLLKPGMSHYDYTHWSLYRNHDLVVSIGGDNLCDRGGLTHRCFESLKNAKRAGAKTIIWGASIGPFHRPRDAANWRRV